MPSPSVPLRLFDPMEIFSREPKSFKMNRNSAQAMNLKSAVAEKLLDFLGNYSDDVLAEYVVVLVCNGKHQYQAKNDLEAFLGSESGQFVTWLWDHLSKHIFPSESSNELPDVANVTSQGDDHKDTVMIDFENHMIGSLDKALSKQGKTCHTLIFPPTSVSSNSSSKETDSCGASQKMFKSKIHPKSFSIEDTSTRNKILRSSKVIDTCECSPVKKKSVQLTSEHEKLDKDSVHALHLPSPKGYSHLRNFQSIIKENSHSGPAVKSDVGVGGVSSLRSVDEMLPSIVTPSRKRGTVWDRLGKPCEEKKSIVTKKNPSLCNGVIIKSSNEQGSCKEHGSIIVQSDGICRRKMKQETILCDDNVDDIMNNHHWAERMSKVRKLTNKHDENGCASQPTRQPPTSLCSNSFLNNVNCHFQTRESPSAKYISSKDLRSFASKSRNSDGPVLEVTSQHSEEDVKPSLEIRKLYETQSHCEKSFDTPIQSVSVGGYIPAKSKSITMAQSQQVNKKSMQEVLDVKLRLRQMEEEICKLRTKQVELIKDNKNHAMSGFHGLSEDDVESRTVFVSNVHFAATKEAISLYFVKCGTVVKVILMTDPITYQSKGSAYVIFAKKESVDKALALNGTSFLCRTLKVIRKADVPTGAASSSQIVVAASQSQHILHSNRTVYQNLQHFNSPFQWNRQQPTTNSSPTYGN